MFLEEEYTLIGLYRLFKSLFTPNLSLELMIKEDDLIF
jgi:hypothetical protein